MTLVINPHVRVGPLLCLEGGEARRYVDGADCGRLLTAGPQLGSVLEEMVQHPGRPLDEAALACVLGDVGGLGQAQVLLRQGVLRPVEEGERPLARPALRAGRAHLFDPTPLLPAGQHASAVPVLLLGLTSCVALVIEALATRDMLAGAVQAVRQAPVLLVGVAVMLAATMVLHELGHAVVLRAAGGRSRSIGLVLRPWPGMYTDTSSVHLLADKWERASVFLAGPVTTIVVSDLLLLAAPVLHDPFPLVSAALIVTAWVNMLLGIANLFPLRGLDGLNAVRHLQADPCPLTGPVNPRKVSRHHHE